MKRICGLTLIFLILFATSILFIQYYNHTSSLKLVEKQKATVLNIYQNHKKELEDMLNYIETNNIDVQVCRNDGYLLVQNQTYTWISQISPVVKVLYENNVSEVWFEKGETGLSMTIYNYFPQNSMAIYLVYSRDDLTDTSEAKTEISENWFLYTLGLT